MANEKGPVDRIDGYTPQPLGDTDPLSDTDVMAGAMMQAQNETADAVAAGEIRLDDAMEYRQERLDAFRNFITGLGIAGIDKSITNEFVVHLISGAQASARWRGSDLGRRIIETRPTEMTRRGWRLQIQPEFGSRKGTSRGDEWPQPPPGAPVQPPRPGPLPPISDETAQIVEAISKEQRRLGAKQAIKEALNYETAFGGGAVLLGVEDGINDLTQPLDLDRIERINHLTAFRGGWDGELIAWRYYNDPRRANFGKPEIFMLRNIGVPISSPPAPGEKFALPAQRIPQGPTGALIFYVHESRMLVFDGSPCDRQVRVQMRGWGDSIFTSVDEALAQFSQSWNGIAVLMQEYSIPVLSMENLAQFMASKDPAKQQIVQSRVLQMQQAMSVARMRMIDAKEKLERLNVPMAGIGEVLDQMTLRIAAAANQPRSVLFGQVQGGLGDAAKGDIRFFYDSIEGEQDERLQPPVEKLTRVQLRAKHGPTNGKEPARWSVVMNPLWQMTDMERATYRKTIAETDQIYELMGGPSAAEITATRFGGSDFNDGPIVLDIEGRERMAKVEEEDRRTRQAAAAKPKQQPDDPPMPPTTPPGTPAPAPPNGAKQQPPAGG